MATATKKKKRLTEEEQRKKEIKDLYAKPAERKGGKYCAPWCGAGCTWAAYQLAKRRARALAKHMGKGWTFRVHENMGWHYNVISPCRRISLHEYWSGVDKDAGIVDKLAKLVPNHYSAFLGEVDSGTGRWVGDGATPEEAVRDAVARGEDNLAKIGALITGLEEWSA